MAEYELYLVSVAGERMSRPLTPIQQLEWSVALNDVGVLYVVLGRESGILWEEGQRIELWRSLPDGGMGLLQVYFVADWGQTQQTNTTGDAEFLWVRGYDLNDLLTTRIVDADAGTAGAAKSGYAAAIMAAYVDENLLTGTVAARDVTAEFDLTMHYSATEGADIDYAASRGLLLGVLQNCAAISGAAGTKMRFWLAPLTAAAGILYIRPYPYGLDRRGGLPFSPEAGNLYNAAWERRGGNSANYAYVGGQGVGTARRVEEVSLGAMTPLTRREVWVENTQITLPASLQDWGRRQLWQRRPRCNFGATLRDTERSALGREWALGDLVAAEYQDRKWEAEVVAIAGMVAEQGDQVQAVLNATEVETT